MKYTIEGFSQQAAQELGLKANDLIVLRWFVDFHATDQMKRWNVGGQDYCWISFKAVREALPILDVGEKHLRQTVFPRLVKAKVLTHRTFKKKDGRGGTYAAFGFGEQYRLLIETQNGQGSPKTSIGTTHGKDKGTAHGKDNKDSSNTGCFYQNKKNKASPENGISDDGHMKELSKWPENSEAESEAFSPELRKFVDSTYPKIYQQYMGCEHPRLKKAQQLHILSELSAYMDAHPDLETEDLECAAEEFLSNSDCGDGNLNLFASSPEIITIRLVRAGFSDMRDEI